MFATSKTPKSLECFHPSCKTTDQQLPKTNGSLSLSIDKSVTHMGHHSRRY